MPQDNFFGAACAPHLHAMPQAVKDAATRVRQALRGMEREANAAALCAQSAGSSHAWAHARELRDASKGLRKAYEAWARTASPAPAFSAEAAAILRRAYDA